MGNGPGSGPRGGAITRPVAKPGLGDPDDRRALDHAHQNPDVLRDVHSEPFSHLRPFSQPP